MWSHTLPVEGWRERQPIKDAFERNINEKVFRKKCVKQLYHQQSRSIRKLVFHNSVTKVVFVHSQFLFLHLIELSCNVFDRWHHPYECGDDNRQFWSIWVACYCSKKWTTYVLSSRQPGHWRITMSSSMIDTWFLSRIGHFIIDHFMPVCHQICPVFCHHISAIVHLDVLL